MRNRYFVDGCFCGYPSHFLAVCRYNWQRACCLQADVWNCLARDLHAQLRQCRLAHPAVASITPETDFPPFFSVYTQQTHSSRVLHGRCGAAWQKIHCTARLMDTFSICNVICHINILPAKHWTGKQHSSTKKDKLFRFSSRPFSPFFNV